MSSILVETPDYSPWFSARNGRLQFRQKRIPSERAPQEEQNDTNFSSVAPSSEELASSITGVVGLVSDVLTFWWHWPQHSQPDVLVSGAGRVGSRDNVHALVL